MKNKIFLTLMSIAFTMLAFGQDSSMNNVHRTKTYYQKHGMDYKQDSMHHSQNRHAYDSAHRVHSRMHNNSINNRKTKRYKTTGRMYTRVNASPTPTQRSSGKLYRPTRLGSSSPKYNTYKKNDNGAGSVTTNPNKGSSGTAPVVLTKRQLDSLHKIKK